MRLYICKDKNHKSLTHKQYFQVALLCDSRYVKKYDALDILHIQNCVISNVTTMGDRGVMVTYYPMCKSNRLFYGGDDGDLPAQRAYHLANARCHVGRNSP